MFKATAVKEKTFVSIDDSVDVNAGVWVLNEALFANDWWDRQYYRVEIEDDLTGAALWSINDPVCAHDVLTHRLNAMSAFYHAIEAIPDETWGQAYA